MASNPERTASAASAIFQRPIGRRAALSLAGASLAVGMTARLPAALADDSPHGLLGDRPYVPPRDGVLHWERLGNVTGDGWGSPARFGDDVLALNGQRVTVDGFMLPYDDNDIQPRFILMGFRSHCPWCLPGGMSSMIDVASVDGGIAMTDRLVTVQGTLLIHEGRDEYEILYSINDATARHLGA
jgi:hypothetical protein